MARKKVNLAWIANDSTRRATFKKRRKGLLKKVSELSTLCDVKACLVVYGPQEPLPVVWPSVHEAIRLVARFRSMPEMEQSKKMMNQEEFLRQRVVKLQDQLRKHERENREIETTLLMYEGLAGRSLHNVGMQEVTSLAWMLEMRMKMVQQRIEMLRVQMAEPSSHVLPAAPPMEGLMSMMEMLRAQMAEPSSQVVPPPATMPVMEMVGTQMVPPVAPMPAMEMAGAQSAEASSQVVQPSAPLVQGPMPVMKEKTAMEAAMEALQRPNWFGDVMNPYGNMMYGGGQQEMVQPYIDNINPWLDPYYFPFN
ncbi:agamous-like MADS-box protein AGL80 [Cocos nucifera]|nr:agamous-like MADS-box protein AGL80 [Cocos nucifera]